METRQYRCPDCDSGAFQGDGRCSYCHGSGINLNLASDAPACPNCKGTGVCPTCGGCGRYPPENPEKTIQTLFN